MVNPDCRNIERLPKQHTRFIKGDSGQCLEYVHLGYESMFERELLVGIEKGFVVSLLEL